MCMTLTTKAFKKETTLTRLITISGPRVAWLILRHAVSESPLHLAEFQAMTSK